jgi:phenylalanine-4-hydroxylase
VQSVPADTHLIALDRDHPGFRDEAYRARRNQIAEFALRYQAGTAHKNILYTAQETDVWDTALSHLVPMHQEKACPQYLQAFPSLQFRAGHIPSFSELELRLRASSGFRFEPVAGLVTPRYFMERLADGVFLATQYMRHHSLPLYTPEPDVIHELIGHGPLLADPEFAEINRLFGEVTRTTSDRNIDRLIRAYWFVLEFGVYREAPNLPHRVLGAGLLSSFGELGQFDTKAELRPFDLDVIATTAFDPTDYQGVLFVGSSPKQMLSELRTWLRDGAD